MSKLVLLSGWGIDARIWRPLAPYWSEDIQVDAPNWPGYGGRPPLDIPGDLDALADAMSADLACDAVWVGWSLGALLAAHLLERLPAPKALVMLGMGPRFTVTEREKGGVTSQELKAFQRAFRRDGEATWHHFLRWQLGGEPAPRVVLERLLALIERTPPASEETLAAGLAQLSSLDASTLLAKPPCPVYRCQGAKDPLIAPLPNDATGHRLEDAGHCPQLSQPATLTHYLASIVHRHSTTGHHREEESS
ncbi:pimeloyl-[acyl-carrier protein] methyl ester esterase [Litchfieldella qijiaojingensis]|uniref:Pimeloyl-[acyl-carrier protein] methyl ester esterase n=1 Tax=Litchfieldella qijiaojingensis TaxID=980347 RepID=A0ABQ2YR75_9GAMM|nr:alpha/beta fold hydrolase [Halomonas qijiaojingensis]GGX90945.1 pimeloyl-[acyl-carrier protein] methyl ester esterase [Halomonas qijiaojingensis]